MAYQVNDKCSLYHEKTGALDPGSVLSDIQVKALKELGSFESLVKEGTIVESIIVKEETKFESDNQDKKGKSKDKKSDSDIQEKELD